MRKAHFLGGETVQRHREEVVVIAVGTLGLVLVVIVRVRVGGDVRLADLGEGPEFFGAEIGHDDGTLAVVDDKLLVDDHLDEPRLVRELVVGVRELVDDVGLGRVIADGVSTG